MHNKSAWRLKGDITGFVKSGSAYPFSGAMSGSGTLFCWNSSSETWLLADPAVNFRVAIYDTGPPPKKGAVKPDKFTMSAITEYSAMSGCPSSVSPLVQASLQELKGGNVHIK